MKANESHKHCQKRLHFFRAAYLAVKSYSFSYNERNTGQFICWFTDNSTAKRMQKTVLQGSHAWYQSPFENGHKLYRKS